MNLHARISERGDFEMTAFMLHTPPMPAHCCVTSGWMQETTPPSMSCVFFKSRSVVEVVVVSGGGQNLQAKQLRDLTETIFDIVHLFFFFCLFLHQVQEVASDSRCKKLSLSCFNTTH